MTKQTKKFIEVVGVKPSESKRTFIYSIQSVAAKEQIGIIRWHGPWRKYVFHPDDQTLYDHHCLRAIADVCEQLTKGFYNKEVIVFEEAEYWKQLGFEKCIDCAQETTFWYVEHNKPLCQECAKKKRLSY